MKTIGRYLGIAAAGLIGVQTASGMQAGDSVHAAIFPGSETNTPHGNPNQQGQGWYQRDMVTPLNYYDDGQARWASEVVKPGGLYIRYCEVKENSNGDLVVRDAYNGAIGVAWIFTNSVYGKYAISFDELRVGSYLAGRVVSRANSQEEWTDISDAFIQHTSYQNLSFTNTLGQGGGLALKVWNTTAMVSDADGTISGLKVTLLETLGDLPAVSLSTDTCQLQENPNLQDTDGITVTARLDGLSARDTTVGISFGGSAVYGVDYTASTNLLFIPAGLMQVSFKISAVDNSAMGGDKTILATLGTLENAVAGETDGITIALIDDERTLTNAGDELPACVFCGDAEDSAAGNPNLSGQAWYRKDLATPLKFYTNELATPKWATSSATGGFTYSHVTTVDSTTLRIVDNWYGALGVGWVYTATESGLYAMSCDSVLGSYVRSEFLFKENPENLVSTWTSLTGEMASLPNGYAVTNWLNRGGSLAVRIYNSNDAAAPINATVKNLKVTLLEPQPKGTFLILR